MARATPMNMIHLLEKINEPLGFGLRGGGGGDGDSMMYYYYDGQNMMDSMIESDSMRNTMTQVRSRITQARDQKKINVTMEPLPGRPSIMPDLKLINSLCPKNQNYCYFLPSHRQAFSVLKQAFMAQPNIDEVYKMACSCRDSTMMNPNLFVYAYCSALVSRKDTRHIQIPSHVEISPDSYCGADVVRQANKMAHMPELAGGPSTREYQEPAIMIDDNISSENDEEKKGLVTGRGNDPEKRMWYFREDILVNAHHFHWHIVFPACSPKDPKAEGYRDRRGELFYYMHHSLIARYNTERLCNGLARVKKIDFNDLTIREGYFSKLSSENAGIQWGSRQANTKISDVRNQIFHLRVEDLVRWRDRILESIDLGYFVKKDKKTGKESREVLDEIKGIDVLGDILENSSSLSPHLQYYGEIGFHNVGHILIASSNDPRGKHREGLGVMGDVSTAMRDPAFYRWHGYIDHMFDLYKMTLPPYPLDGEKNKFPLRWKGIEIVPGSFFVKAKDNQERNKLQTFWDYKEVDLARGLDFRRNVNEGMGKKPVMGRFTHLNHGQFNYFLKIANNTGKPVKGTIRIFMAPRKDEDGEMYSLSEQRLLFFEMDKVSKPLKPGVNDIRIESTESSVTLRDEDGSSFRNIEKVHKETKSRPDAVYQSQCSCGWPQHLLLPRGSGGGTEYDLFVIVTDGQVDMVPDLNRKMGCNSALSFCGVLNQKYPDTRPMGFPFDRKPFLVKLVDAPDDFIEQCPETEMPCPDLKRYVESIKNSGSVVVTIFHENKMKNKGEVDLGQQVIRPDGRCIQLRDYYKEEKGNNNGKESWGNSNSGGGSGGNSWGLQNQRPSNMDQQYDYQQQQWGGRGPQGGAYGRPGGPSRGRSGRGYEPDEEDWEHLGREY